MNETGPVVGIDGCRGGWVCCTLWADNRFAFDLIRETEDLVDVIERCSIACVDMPIGIPSEGQRKVDQCAKRILGRYHARVFMTPTREVLAETSYDDANSTSRETTGKGLSKQSWHLFPKIREIDEMLRNYPRLLDRVEECHPEIALWGLTRRVVSSSKSTNDGLLERISILREILVAPDTMFASARGEIHRKDAKDDDIVDAMICAATGVGLRTQCLYNLDEERAYDTHGIPMNMVYHTP